MEEIYKLFTVTFHTQMLFASEIMLFYDGSIIIQIWKAMVYNKNMFYLEANI